MNEQDNWPMSEFNGALSDGYMDVRPGFMGVIDINF